MQNHSKKLVQYKNTSILRFWCKKRDNKELLTRFEIWQDLSVMKELTMPNPPVSLSPGVDSPIAIAFRDSLLYKFDTDILGSILL